MIGNSDEMNWKIATEMYGELVETVDEGDCWAVTLDRMAMLQGLLLSEVAPEGKAVCIMKEATE